MTRKIRWGVLGVARMATTEVILAMQRGALTEIVGISSRSREKAAAAVSH